MKAIGGLAWVVKGQSGEYSDTTVWEVCAFSSEKEAEKFCEYLNNWLKDNGIHYDQNRDAYDGKRDDLKNPLDPHMYLDYTGARYDISAPLKYLSKFTVEEDLPK